MSLKVALLQQIINAFAQSGIIQNLIHDDIEFLIHAAKYAEKRLEAQINPANTADNTAANTLPSPAPAPVNRVGSVSGNPVSVAPAPQPTVDPSSTHDAAQTLSFDRGPEPQEVGEVLDTKAPSNVITNDTDAGFDPTDPPPDYTRLPAALPSTKG